jgi:Domain of unknown function (DUF1707)
MRTEVVNNPVNKNVSDKVLVGNADREVVVSFLETAYAEGYLTPEQHGRRTALALQAVTLAGLSTAVDTLPGKLYRALPDKPAPRVQPPAGIRAARCLFLVLATVCIFTWIASGGNGNSGYAAIAVGTGVPAILATLFCLVTRDQY